MRNAGFISSAVISYRDASLLIVRLIEILAADASAPSVHPDLKAKPKLQTVSPESETQKPNGTQGSFCLTGSGFEGLELGCGICGFSPKP